MEQPGLHGRHRNKDGEISRKHGKTFIRTMRSAYGPSFAPAAAEDERLENVLATLDEASLNHLVHDHEQGQLQRKIF